MNTLYEIFFQATDGTLYPLDPTEATLTRPACINSLEPRTLDLTLARNTQIKEGDIVIVKKSGAVILRGYVKFYSIASKTEKHIQVFGMEDLLLYRVTPEFFYDQYTTLTFGSLFSDEVVAGDIPGLLAMANGYILPGQPWSEYSTNITQLAGLGTKSDIGTSKIFYIAETNVQELTEYKVLSTMADNESSTAKSVYRDELDLYVCIGEDVEAWSFFKRGGLIAENYKDTGVRIGICEPYEVEIEDSSLITNANVIGDLIMDICASKGYFVSFTDDENYTYLNISETEGRGIEDGVYSFLEEDLISIEKAERDEPFTHAVLGIGDADWKYACDNHAPGVRAKIERTITFEKEFGDDEGKLSVLTQDYFDDQSRTDQWTIEPARDDLILYPLDWIKLTPDYENTMLLKVLNIDEDCLTGMMTIDLSERKTDMGDVFEFADEAEQIFSKTYPISFFSESQSDLAELDEEKFSTFSIPDGALDSNLKVRAILTLTLGYKLNSDEEPLVATNIGDAGKINLNVSNGSFLYWIQGVPVGTSRNNASYSIDVTDAITADDADTTFYYVISDASGGSTPADAEFTIGESLTIYKRAN